MLLECKSLCCSYDGRTVVNNVSFSINQNDYVCIVGANGSGKSTLMKSLLGLVEKDSGEINFGSGVKTEVGYLPQKLSISNDFPASVYEIILSGCICNQFIPFYTKENRCRADDALKLLSIENIKNSSFSELSGGQQQRVLLARAICAASKLIMLDEPITSLDLKTSNDFYEALEHMNKEHNISVLMVSHDVETAVKTATKILHMDTNMLFFGDTADYIKTPYYKQLIGETNA